MPDEADRPGDPPGYPARWEADVALSDGGTVHVRPVRPSDRDALLAFHSRQSSESIYFRYFSPRPRLSDRELERLTAVDYVDRMGFVALLGDDMIGMASYDRWGHRNIAEVSFFVDEEQQGRGLATILLEYLIVAAREAGFAGLTAQVLPDNRKMLGVLHSAGFSTKSEFAGGIIEVSIALEPDAEALRVIEDRARHAEARSVRRLLAPSSVAIIGASRSPGTVGFELFRSLIGHGFKGTVYPVNTSGEPVAGVRSYPSVLEVPDEVDVAVIVVPATNVLAVVEECGRKAVEGLVIVSAGFAEYGPFGHAGMRVIVERARRFGMRVIGPESLGIVNTSPDVAMQATFADVTVLPGRVGFLTQSGTLGLAALDHARRVGLGISAFVDVGSKIDVSGNDLLQYWDEDPRTDVIALYLESFGNPRRFTRIARRLARHKPIVAIKGGNARLLTEEVAQQTGLAAWPAEATVAALLEQSGVIRVESPVELFDVARLLADQPVPQGRRVAIVTNSHGAAALTEDACVGEGLELAELGSVTRGRISAAKPPPGSSTTNPVDLTYAAGPDVYERVVAALIDDEGVDAVIAIHAPSFPRRDDGVARAIGAAVSAASGKTVVASFLGADIGCPIAASGGRIPLFEFPAGGVRALARAARYQAWRSSPEGVTPELGALEPPVDVDAVHRLIEPALQAPLDGGGWLGAAEVRVVLDALGLPLYKSELVPSVEAASQAAAAIGYPVVLKATGVLDPHPGEEGGVALGIHDQRELLGTYGRMRDLHGERLHPAMVQAMVSGVEVQVGCHQHASFGAVMSVKLGGPARAAANVGTPVRVLPLSHVDAYELVQASPVAPMLAGVAPGIVAGTDAANELVRVLLRISVALDALPELADVVFSPLSVNAGGVHVLDARIRVAPYRWDPTPAVRRL